MKNKIINHGNGLVEYIRYWNSGNIRSHYPLLNGKCHGEFRVYNEDGTLGYHDYNINEEVQGEKLKYFYD